MRIKKYISLFLILAAASPLQAAPLELSDSQQTGVQVTVYNSNLALIKDVREADLPAGQGELRFGDVAAQIMPQTVHVKSAGGGFQVLEQNYEYDLMNSERLLDKYVGKKIKLIDSREYQDRKDVIEATLLSNNQGPVYEIGGEIYLGHPGIQVLPQIPENLIAKPTLTWIFDNKSQTKQPLEVSYLTGGLNWEADYVFVLTPDQKGGDLSGWVTIDNQSGASYKNAVLKLMAGNVNRVQQDRVYFKKEQMSTLGAASAQQPFQEHAFFEYHIYDLQRQTTLKDRQTKQISLLEAAGVGAEKEYVVQDLQDDFYSRIPDAAKTPVQVFIKFKNAEKNKLGMPLPAGVMRLYQPDEKGILQFIGEDRIEHTPKDEDVKLKVGQAFDIVAERTQISFKQLTSQMNESEWEIKIRNHKQEDVTVSVLETLPGTWKVETSSQAFTQKDAFTIRFDVPVKKDQEVKVTYKVVTGI